jgi:hypothetical protein
MINVILSPLFQINPLKINFVNVTKNRKLFFVHTKFLGSFAFSLPIHSSIFVGFSRYRLKFLVIFESRHYIGPIETRPRLKFANFPTHLPF